MYLQDTKPLPQNMRCRERRTYDGRIKKVNQNGREVRRNRNLINSECRKCIVDTADYGAAEEGSGRSIVGTCGF